jgi:2-dehydro-3-deoxygluconokinase
MSLVDVLITTEEDTFKVFGIKEENYREVALRLAERYNLPTVAITLRGDLSVLRNEWTSIAYSHGDFFDDRTYEIEIVDRIGGGDAFASGFIFGLLTGSTAEAVRYGNALSALKQTNWTDFCWASRQEAEALMGGAGTRILR